VRSHIQPVVWRGVQLPATTAVLPPVRVRRWLPYFRAAALTQRLVVTSQNRWLRVVSMTAVRPAARIVRLYRSVSRWTRTAVTVSGEVWPVVVLVARTLSPGSGLLTWRLADGV
jgi:hypothetical protein